MRGVQRGLLLVALGVLTACPPPAGDCFKNQDCPAGQLCNSAGQCVPITVPRSDGGPARDRTVGVDTADAGLEDSGREDAGPEDAPPEDGAPDTGVPDLGALDRAASVDARQPDAGPAQVDTFGVCQQPSALTLAADGSELHVGCVGDDRIQVYGSVDGLLRRRLNSLTTPCQPAALHLREDRSALWVSCQAAPQPKVLNVTPSTGATNQTAITDTAAPRVRFASGSNRLAWVTVQAQAYSLRNCSSTVASEVGSGLVLGGGGVAVRSDGSTIYFTQSSSTANIISCIDPSNGPMACNLFAPFSGATLLAISPGATALPTTARNVLLAANTQSFVRLNANGQVAPVVNIGQGVTRALTVQPDGRFFYLGVYNSLGGASRVLQITSDAATVVSAATEQSLAGCELTDLVADDDGRVFVACTDQDSVQVLAF
jgi:DNA-binding beta-propeller fold protein YncE